jgi:hypothetical protein
MDSGGVYSTLSRLLQIEGPSFADNVTATLAEAGIPKEDVEKVLEWAIGDDFHRIQLMYWPHRFRERLKLDITDNDKVKDSLLKVAEAWNNREDNSRST